MFQTLSSKLILVGNLWLLGIWESVQLHRCIVLFVLDRKKCLWPPVARCLFLNGCLYLGSIIWWSSILNPLLSWLLNMWVVPSWGSRTGCTILSCCRCAFDSLLILPIYLVAMASSSSEYQKVAESASEVHHQRKLSHALLTTSGQPRSDVISSVVPINSHQGGGLDGAAEEVFRVVFFVIHYVQVCTIRHAPIIGNPLHFVMMSWLWAYYCFDYRWTLQGLPLSERLGLFEAHWAFFGGFGSILAASALVLPFYWGSALTAVAFPLFVIIATDSDLQLLNTRTTCIGKAPTFWFAIRATHFILRCLKSW
ncbi:hypothetical protein CEUSTIGMA_g9770.t1 [Chlamydomonas eustigma]|uniref:Uncharacterized protein n=1 Tax=Chlamydomonas eustigma TaxID=1157962 RepID=A0A250XGY8_9CHLO|nr:hypothetical protein CEUSTIGMA_g9770.t1 [Chlamydomonas eustigma]|eukprot:GAX82341.1 hypothetical protein CEUSTIGMA_g9770.t1 [Chlamydomonas eustigma]